MLLHNPEHGYTWPTRDKGIDTSTRRDLVLNLLSQDLTLMRRHLQLLNLLSQYRCLWRSGGLVQAVSVYTGYQLWAMCSYRAAQLLSLSWLPTQMKKCRTAFADALCGRCWWACLARRGAFLKDFIGQFFQKFSLWFVEADMFVAVEKHILRSLLWDSMLTMMWCLVAFSKHL